MKTKRAIPRAFVSASAVIPAPARERGCRASGLPSRFRAVVRTMDSRAALSSLGETTSERQRSRIGGASPITWATAQAVLLR